MCVLMVFAIDSEIRECHVYKDVWNAGIDFELSHPPKVCNHEDWYAITHPCSVTLKSSCDAVNFCCGN